MTALLAQTTPPPAVLASWLEVAMYLVLSAAGVVGLLVGIKQLREKQVALAQPFVVKPHDTWATKDELTQVHGRIGRERNEVNAMIAGVQSAASREIQAVAAQVAQHAVDGEKRVVRINERIDALRDDIKDAPAATVALLRQTKGLL